jgi:predicted ArsR family transcriptional regulator
VDDLVALSPDSSGLILLIADGLISRMKAKEISAMTKRRMQRTGWNKRLFASTRGRILALLQGENHTVNDLAAALQLTDNAVRAHLLSLERDGLVKQRGTRPGKRKPHVAYGLSTEAEHIFPKAYGPLLAHLVTVLSNRLTLRALRAMMREVGRSVAADYFHRWNGRNRRERVEAALDLLHDLGGLAKLDERGGKRFIAGRNGCPFATVTSSHPEACLIIESLLSTVLGVPAKKCCEYGETPRCCFELKG